jgi:CMP-N-acetylneuraminic acid synthetase
VTIPLVAFVPMRHSSERVPGKNYRPFHGRPLFHHIVDTLLAVPQIDRIVIDTDSPTVKEQCSQQFPSVTCVDRPAHLLGGETPMTAVLAHDAMLFPSDWYLQTHSTNPLLQASTISRAIEELASELNHHDSLFSVTRLQTRLYDAEGHPVNHDPAVLLRTQDLPPLFEENSNLYIFTDDLIRSGRRLGDRPLMFELDPLEALDIDEESDFVIAEMLHQRAVSR